MQGSTRLSFSPRPAPSESWEHWLRTTEDPPGQRATARACGRLRCTWVMPHPAGVRDSRHGRYSHATVHAEGSWRMAFGGFGTARGDE